MKDKKILAAIVLGKDMGRGLGGGEEILVLMGVFYKNFKRVIPSIFQN